jgi:hypothetical protein
MRWGMESEEDGESGRALERGCEIESMEGYFWRRGRDCLPPTSWKVWIFDEDRVVVDVRVWQSASDLRREVQTDLDGHDWVLDKIGLQRKLYSRGFLKSKHAGLPES